MIILNQISDIGSVFLTRNGFYISDYRYMGLKEHVACFICSSCIQLGGQSSSPTSAIRSVKGPIMSTQEGKSNTTSTDGNRDSSVLSSASTDAGKSVEDLTSVVNNTSALNSPVKERLSTSVSGSNQSTSQAKLLCKSRSAASATPLTETNVDENRPLACSSDFDLSESSVLPSDTVPDEILKDMSGDGTGSDANVMPSLDLSGIISSFGEMPAQTGSNTAVSASHRDTASAVGRSADSQIPSIIRGKPYLQDDDLSYTTTRRQSRRRTPAPPKPASRSSSRDPSDTDGEGETSGSSSHDYSLRKTSSPFSSGMFVFYAYTVVVRRYRGPESGSSELESSRTTSTRAVKVLLHLVTKLSSSSGYRHAHYAT